MIQQWRQLIWICLVTCFPAWSSKADDNFLIKQFLESAYVLPTDPKTELTDVILVNAYVTNQSQIETLAKRVVDAYTTAPTAAGLTNVLQKIFAEPDIATGANIHLFRERTVDRYYRLDEESPQLKVFANYGWNDGQFTNENHLAEKSIHLPPTDNKLWTRYVVQRDSMSVTTRDKPLMRNGGFYTDLYGWPPAVRANFIFQTVDPKIFSKQLQEVSHATVSPALISLIPDWLMKKCLQQDIECTGWDDPVASRHFQELRIDTGRLQEVLDGKSKVGRWVIVPAKSGAPGIKQLSLVGPDGGDHDLVGVLFSESRPDRPLLAYVRNGRTGSIEELFAWDYRADWQPARLLKIQHHGEEKLHANLQNIVYSGKTTDIDWSLFKVDVTQYRSITDYRSEPAVNIISGKVYVFEPRGEPGTISKGVLTNIDAKAFLKERFGVEGKVATNPPPRNLPAEDRIQ